MKACTCRLVAAEQLPDTTACAPAGGAAARPRQPTAAMPKLAGRPIATPEPAVTSGMSLQRRAQPQQVVVAQRIDDGDGDAFGAQLRDALADRRFARAATAW